MKKQAFHNGSIKKQIIRTPKEKLITKLELTTSVIDFYKQKEKILEHLKGTSK